MLLYLFSAHKHKICCIGKIGLICVHRNVSFYVDKMLTLCSVHTMRSVLICTVDCVHGELLCTVDYVHGACMHGRLITAPQLRFEPSPSRMQLSTRIIG